MWVLKSEETSKEGLESIGQLLESKIRDQVKIDMHSLYFTHGKLRTTDAISQSDRSNRNLELSTVSCTSVRIRQSGDETFARVLMKVQLH